MPEWPPDTSGGKALAAAADAGPDAAVEAFLRSLVGDDAWAAMPDATKALRLVEGPALVADLASIRHVAPYDPADLTTPLVVARGGRGPAHHRLGVEWLLANAPHVAFHLIDGAGHAAHRTHPEAFASFVERVVRGATPSG